MRHRSAYRSAWEAYDKLVDRKHRSLGFSIHEVSDETKVCEDNLREIRVCLLSVPTFITCFSKQHSFSKFYHLIFFILSTSNIMIHIREKPFFKLIQNVIENRKCAHFLSVVVISNVSNPISILQTFERVCDDNKV